MKTEDFDDAIRRKLESLDRLHDQQEVDSVLGFVQSQKALKRRNLTLIISLPLLLLFGGLLTLNILQFHENVKLKQTVTKHEIALQQLRTENKISTQKQNTITENRQISNINSVNITPNASSEKKVPELNGSSDKLVMNQSKTNQNSTLHKNTQQKITNQKFTNQNYSLAKEKVNTPAELVMDEVKKSDTPSAFNNSGSGVQEKSLNSNESDLASSTYENSAIDENSVINFNQDKKDFASNKNDSLDDNNDTIKIAKKEPASETTEIIPDLPVYKKSWNYRMGLGFDIGNFQIAYSIIGEAIYKERWAINVGFKILKNGDEFFDDDDDFHHQKKEDFKKTYQNHVSDASNKDIKIKNTLFQIPLNLNYIMPLKSKFALLLGIGTDLDIYVKQHVEYKHSNTVNDMQGSVFVTNSKPVYFNNIVVTTGIQKTVRRFVFQLSPYLSPQLKQVDYKSKNLYYGLRIRTLFNF